MRVSKQAVFGDQPPPVQLIAMGCPGSGKSYALKQFASSEGVKVFRTTFHPELSYGDFVGSYKPVPVYVSSGGHTYKADGTEIKGVWANRIPVVKYEYRPGPFINAYKLYPDFVSYTPILREAEETPCESVLSRFQSFS